MAFNPEVRFSKNFSAQVSHDSKTFKLDQSPFPNDLEGFFGDSNIFESEDTLFGEMDVDQSHSSFTLKGAEAYFCDSAYASIEGSPALYIDEEDFTDTCHQLFGTGEPSTDNNNDPSPTLENFPDTSHQLFGTGEPSTDNNDDPSPTLENFPDTYYQLFGTGEPLTDNNDNPSPTLENFPDTYHQLFGTGEPLTDNNDDPSLTLENISRFI